MSDDTQTPPRNGSQGPGRPTEYKLQYCERAAELCASGSTDFEIAEELGVHVSTLYRWQKAHPEFRESLLAGKEASDERVVRSLYHRAVGYSYHAVKIMQDKGAPVVVPYVEHVPPDVGAASLWLTNRQGDTWRSKQTLEHTGKDGAPIDFRNADNLTDEQLAAIALSGRPAPAEPTGSKD